MPCLRRTTSASARSPLVSTSARLHSIMPAPVRSRSCFTCCALISIMSSRLYYLGAPPLLGRAAHFEPPLHFGPSLRFEFAATLRARRFPSLRQRLIGRRF